MLDDLKLVEKIDENGMLNLLNRIPDIFFKTANMTKNAIRGLRFHNIVNVVILAQGISAIDAKLVKTMVQNNIVIPIIIVKDYKLPAFVDDKTLVIALSLTGNEKEIIFAYEEAKNRKAKVLAITAGGKLKEYASYIEAPVITLPKDLPSETSIGYFFFPILVVLIEQGIVRKKSLYDIEGSIEFLSRTVDKLTPQVSTMENIAKTLAKNLYSKLPILYGTSNVTNVIAIRWKFLINKNVRFPAFFDILSESGDIKVKIPAEMLSKFHITILQLADKERSISNKVNANIEMLESLTFDTTKVRGEGDTFLKQILYLLILGDYTSAYLSILYKIKRM